MSKLKWRIVLNNQHVITLIKVGESLPVEADVTVIEQGGYLWAKACYDEDPAMNQSLRYRMRYANYATPPGTGVPYYEVEPIPLCAKLTPNSHKPNICSLLMMELINNPELRAVILGGGDDESMRKQLSIPRERLEIMKDKDDDNDGWWFQKLFKR